jgi:hypothetical protein
MVAIVCLTHQWIACLLWVVLLASSVVEVTAFHFQSVVGLGHLIRHNIPTINEFQLESRGESILRVKSVIFGRPSTLRLFAHHPRKKAIKKIMDRQPKKSRPSDIKRNNVNLNTCINEYCKDNNIKDYEIVAEEGKPPTIT